MISLDPVVKDVDDGVWQFSFTVFNKYLFGREIHDPDVDVPSIRITTNPPHTLTIDPKNMYGAFTRYIEVDDGESISNVQLNIKVNCVPKIVDICDGNIVYENNSCSERTFKLDCSAESKLCIDGSCQCSADSGNKYCQMNIAKVVNCDGSTIDTDCSATNKVCTDGECICTSGITDNNGYCCTTNQVIDEAGECCTPNSPDPNLYTCSADHTQVVFNNGCTTQTIKTCTTGKVCRDGECVGEIEGSFTDRMAISGTGYYSYRQCFYTTTLKNNDYIGRTLWKRSTERLYPANPENDKEVYNHIIAPGVPYMLEEEYVTSGYSGMSGSTYKWRIRYYEDDGSIMYYFDITCPPP